ncbi:hypothetical protein ECC02_002959 [Trypanosoma cruzi]|uniref:Sec16 Sec23-binding domain-containing protein n=1 Tax=Trypanosoma cruzi TaxID=5693 RepID=A0A7J6YBA5_TRYCR|nr:hypothetical protein ECC02_002959 [Trypanosoma cruzi]
MRLKSTPLSCAFAWAPSHLGTPTFLAAASLAGAMDEEFSNEAFLEIRLVDVTQTDETEMPVVARTFIPERVFRVDWCSFGSACGMIAVACCNGAVYVYDASVMMKNYQLNPHSNTEEPLLCAITEHRGAVRGCQFNPSQPNFLAIGAEDGKWDVWTLEDPRDPQQVPVMSDAAHTAAIVHLQWHPKYPHIIATASSNCVVNVWNLKSQTLAVSLNVSKGGKSGASANAIAWHPVVATQIAVAMDEKDSAIQIWDLKKSMVPLREMRGHESAVTGLAWNPGDASMMASCSADGKTIWWDPSTGEKNGALQQENSYVIDVQWSPVLPAVLATSSFEPLLCVSTAEDVSTAASAGGPVPKWLKRPCGASISLGGFVASLVPNSTTKVGLTCVLGKSAMSPATSQDLAFRDTLRKIPRDSEERVKWLKEQNYSLLAAAAACKDDRTPILAYLNEETSTHDEGEDPFETMEASQKSLEDVAAAHIAAGRIREAVEVCLDGCRFDDAFVIAYLQGGTLLQRVQQEYAHYTLTQSRQKRHVVYAAAIASGDFGSLTESENVPWKEALSVIISFVGDGFSDACDRLGEALKKKGNREGAMTCFVCSGNVDAVMQLWREDNTSLGRIMRDALLLEEVTGRRVTSVFFSDCLYEYGMKLVGEGVLTEGVSILQRSASIGNHSAAVMVDRLKFHVPVGQVVFPFAMMPLSDSPSPSCATFITQQQQQLRAQPQQPQPQQQQQLQSQQRFPMPGQYQQPPKPLQQPPMPGHHYQQQQQQQQLPPSLPQQQQQPMQSPNFYLQQQQPQSQGITATRSVGATMPQGPTDAAPQPRLMPHPISSYSSMKQGAPVSSGSPLAMASAGYSNGMPSAPPRQQPQFAPQGGYAAPQQNYVDPSRPLPPPPLPSGLRGASVPGGQALARPPQLAGIQQMQQPMSSQGTGVAPPPPPPSHPGAPVVPPQQAGGFVGSSHPLPRVSANASTYSSGVNDDTSVGNINSQGAISSLYGNPSASTVPLAPSTNAAASVTAPPPIRPMMPVPGNPPFGVTTREDSMGGSLTNSYGIGNATYQASLTPLENKVLHQNNMSRPPTAAVTPSTYGLQPNANKSSMPSPYGSSAIPSAMASRVPGSVPFTASSTVDDADLSHFDITSLNPSYHALAQKLCADVQQVSNAQRRLVISKAALELFKLLQRGALSPDVVFLVSNYVNLMGTPLAKNAWRQLSDAHFDVVQPFLNLKFLSSNDGAPN